MDPLTYRNPVLVNPPFRNDLVAAIARQVGEGEVVVLDRLLPMLDGAHGMADIYGRLVADGVSVGTITKALGALQGLGCLAELDSETEGAGDPQGAEAKSRYGGQVACLEEWLKVRQSPEEARTAGVRAQSMITGGRVIVMGLGRTGGGLIEALALAGVGRLYGIRAGDSGGGGAEEEMVPGLVARVRAVNPLVQFNEITAVGEGESEAKEEESGLPLLVYCPDEFREEVCRELNTLALTLGSSLLVYRESPFCVELGPLIVPRQTACYVCYELRRKAAEPDTGPGEDPPSAPSALNFSCGANLLALEIVKVLTRAAFPVTRGKLWRLGLFDGSVSVHPVLKLPRCPACGVQRLTPPRRIWEE